MSNPVFFIDGQMEKKIIQALCPNQPIRVTGLNGKDVTVKAIAKKIAPLIRLLGNKFYPIVILLDKEARKITFEEMANQTKEALIEEGITDQDLRIGVADRMIENWILADWETFAGKKTKPPETEGINGSSIIKKVKGGYDKTTEGVEYFIAARQNILYNSSESYKHFIDQLNGIKCAYINFKK